MLNYCRRLCVLVSLFEMIAAHKGTCNFLAWFDKAPADKRLVFSVLMQLGVLAVDAAAAGFLFGCYCSLCGHNS